MLFRTDLGPEAFRTDVGVKDFFVALCPGEERLFVNLASAHDPRGKTLLAGMRVAAARAAGYTASLPLITRFPLHVSGHHHEVLHLRHQMPFLCMN